MVMFAERTLTWRAYLPAGKHLDHGPGWVTLYIRPSQENVSGIF